MGGGKDRVGRQNKTLPESEEDDGDSDESVTGRGEHGMHFFARLSNGRSTENNGWRGQDNFWMSSLSD